MDELLWQIKDIDSFSVYVTAAFAVAVFLFLRELAQVPLLALVSLPFLMAGGVLAPLFYRTQMITLAYDKDANVAAMCASGVLAALALVVAAKWLWSVFMDRVVGRTGLVAVAPAPRRRKI